VDGLQIGLQNSSGFRGGNRAGRVRVGRVRLGKFDKKKIGSRVGFGSIQSESGRVSGRLISGHLGFQVIRV
jgi:hypothetical protein